MSEGDVSLIHDEDLLRRMWQQTEDFSRKKEIRAHMYRLREERLRNLYSPEPPATEGKGCEFTSTQGHIKSFANQTFQSMKSKEVRDAGSPPKEFTYRGQDLKELSNAGWNVESENRTSDDGHTHVKTVQANIEGRYDVEGGRGQFAAIDTHKQAVTEYHDDNSSLKRNESSSNTAAHEQVVQQTADGTHISSNTSTSSSTSKFQQVSSTKHETVPYLTNDDYDQTRQTSYDTNRNEEVLTRREGTSDYEQKLRTSDLDRGELMSRKVEYPDDNTKVIVETRRLPDGTRLTSTRREFRAPVTQSSRTEHHSQQINNESKSYHTSSEHKSDVRESTSKVTHKHSDYSTNIVDSQKTVDDYDFKRNQENRNLTIRDDDSTRKTNNQHYVTNIDESNKNEVITQNLQRENIKEYNQTRKVEERDEHIRRQNKVEEVIEKKTTSDQYQTTYNTDFSQKKVSNDWSPTHQAWASTLRADTPTSTRPSTRASSPGGRTFQSSTSSLRSSVSPDKTCRKPPSRGGSPSKVERGSPTRTISDRYSSTHSTHSVTETKTSRFTSPDGRPPHGRSPTRATERESPDKTPQRNSVSPEKKSKDHIQKFSTSPERKCSSSPTDQNLRKPDPRPQSSHSPDRKPVTSDNPRDISPTRPRDHQTRASPSPSRRPYAAPYRSSVSPDKSPSTSPTKETQPQRNDTKIDYAPGTSPDRKPSYLSSSDLPDNPKDTSRQPSTSPDRKPGYMRPTEASNIHSTDVPKTASPDRKSPLKQTRPYVQENKVTKAKEDHYKFIDEETKMYSRKDTKNTEEYSEIDRSIVNKKIENRPGKSPSPVRKNLFEDEKDKSPSESPRPTLRKNSRSPSPPKGPVTFTQDSMNKKETTKNVINSTEDITKHTFDRRSLSPEKDSPTSAEGLAKPSKEPHDRAHSPSKYTTYDKKHYVEETNVIKNTKDITKHTFDRRSLSPAKDSPISAKGLPKPSKEPHDRDSPSKFATYDKKRHVEETNVIKNTEDITKHTFDRRSLSPEKDSPTSSKGLTKPSKEPHDKEYSPSKYGTYDKKHEVEETNIITTENKYDSLKRSDKSPRKPTDHHFSPTRKTPRGSSSPSKYTSRDTQLRSTTDFITHEKTTEELNTKTVKKDRPRQLVTPSTSPTRKPKKEDTAPSTGQSSPTTSVSGFIYYSSPRNEKTIVTDLDEQESYSEIKETEEITTTSKRPDSLKVNQSPTPSKIPCRSPSPEKRPSPVSEQLPRKSSLKKPSAPVSQVSPTEKPPSSFRISPTVETKDQSEHNIVIKDSPEKIITDTNIKSKPPLERRETYEERCRKILGMMADTTTKTITKKSKDSISNTSSPSVSPCNSPTTKGDLSFDYKNNKTTITTDNDVTDFITQEREQFVDIPRSIDSPKLPKKTHKLKSRENSPTKLQDIISHTEKPYKTSNTEHKDDISITKRVQEEKFTQKCSESNDDKIKRTSVSPEKKPLKTKDNPTSEYSKSPDRQQIKPDNVQRGRSTSPSKQAFNPDRKAKQPTSESPAQSSPLLRQETYDVEETHISNKIITSQEPKLHSPSRKNVTHYSNPKNNQEPRHLRTPSPNKKTTIISETTEQLIQSEREQEILDRVQKSLRRLSPERKEKSPSREKSPTKSTTSLQDIDISTKSEYVDASSELYEEDLSVEKRYKPKEPSDQKVSSKPASRNVSPAKKAPLVASPTKSSIDEPNKPRSISPKKTPSFDRPQSPQVPKTSGIKPREPVQSYTNKKPTSPTKTEKTIVSTETKKSSLSKQNSLTKITTSKIASKSTQSTPHRTIEPESKFKPSKANIKDSNISKKEPETRVTRTTSDISIKTKKSSPQRMKSKPEIQVSEVNTSTTKSLKQTNNTVTTRLQKPSTQTKLPNKPKSATALNTSTDEDDIIIDVQQAKSSRENSPDRICPTPVNFTEDVSTPRYPDEINEPDDEFRQRTHNTIQEVESIVDDIVEICEDEELFSRNTDINRSTEMDESLLSVTDKVSKFTNKIDTLTKTKDTTKQFKDVETKHHSDLVTDNLKSDECLLSVSEKVNKFAKGPRDAKDSKSPSRKIVDEYDKNTIYQDDYTKLSVNDKAHLFVETAENVMSSKTKISTKVERPDLTDVDESLKSDDCLLSVSDKVNKFVKTAEQFLSQSHELEEKDKKIKEQHDIIMKKLVENVENDADESKKNEISDVVISEENEHDYKKHVSGEEKRNSFSKETASSHAKIKDYPSPNLKVTQTPTIKITTLRSSEAVKKAKALFENIASTQKTKDTTHTKKTKLTDIGVMKKSPKTDSTIVLHPSLEDGFANTDVDSEIEATHLKSDKQDRPASKTPARQQPPVVYNDKPRHVSPSRLTTQSPEAPRNKSPMPQTTGTNTNRPSHLTTQPPEYSRTQSPMRQSSETVTITKTVSSRYPTQRSVSPNLSRPELDKNTHEKVPGYQRPTKTSQMKEEIKSVEETEISSRRGSGKFGVELRRTSVERSTTSSERRRSVEHHQPCIEDIFDLDLLEQMLEKVVGYEQRRRIRAQIRIAKKKMETSTETHTKTVKHNTLTLTNTKSPDRHYTAKSPERHSKVTTQKTVPDHTREKIVPTDTVVSNGHAKEPKTVHEPRQRPRSPDKLATKAPVKSTSPVRQPSPDKKTRTASPSKTAPTKPKPNRFSEYASAYLKKAGINDSEQVKISESKVKKTSELVGNKTVKQEEHKLMKSESKLTTSKTYSERSSSKDTIDIKHVNGKRTPSPEKKRSPERKAEAPSERLREKSPSPISKRQISDTDKKETIIKTVYDGDKKLQTKQVQQEKPSWVTNRNLKKISSETRTFSSKKIESEKPKYRATSPSKVISKPIDVITSSYGPGPLDADGKPLFGIRALRNGGSNYQVKGTVIRQEFHSHNGGEPTGSVSVTAYSNSPEELERLLLTQGERPSRLHGLAAITTTKKFGGDTGHSYNDVHTKEDRAALDHFTHNDRRVSDSRVEISDVTSSEDRHHETRREDRMVEDRQDRRDSHNTTQSHEKSEKQERLYRQDKVQKQEKQERPRQRVEERREKTERMERREDKKTVRQSSVKSLTEKYIKSASETSKTERSTYPKAGLILRTTSMKDSVSSDSSAHAGLARTDSEHSLGSVEDTVVSSTTERDGRTVTTSTRAHAQQRSFLDSSTKVTGVQDILTRMKNADIVIQEGDSTEDTEARALLNKFLGATVLMAGMQSYVTDKGGHVHVKKETVRSSGGKVTSSVEEFDLDQCWDERLLRKLLDECTDYEQRRRLRARIRTLMAEQEACASAVTEALAASGEGGDGSAAGDAREEEEVTTVTSSVRRNSSEKTISSSTTTKTTKVIESMTRSAPKPVSPFAKFRQLEKQNSTNSPKM